MFQKVSICNVGPKKCKNLILILCINIPKYLKFDLAWCSSSIDSMVLTLDGNSDIWALQFSIIGNLIGLRHLFRSAVVTNLIFIFRKGCSSSIHSMVLTIDGNSDIWALELSKIRNLICLRHMFRSAAVTNPKSIFRKGLAIFTSTQHVLSYHLISISKYHGV